MALESRLHQLIPVLKDIKNNYCNKRILDDFLEMVIAVNKNVFIGCVSFEYFFKVGCEPNTVNISSFKSLTSGNKLAQLVQTIVLLINETERWIYGISRGLYRFKSSD